ncbi:hypothetical protein MMYC01_208215 [Madurella mycetomatis]|uniref:Uncharacterized protein n=1 Tax=Madurella mycetomatis TaxID=100816 RepID=A0A175VTV7_9PEZI|nr:hypothetical protein MMYC01_208215 [Madurella mycetomatis]
MKFTVAAVLAFVTVAFAYPAVEHDAPVRRQNIANNIDVSVPAMTDQGGNVVPFDANRVYQDARAKGI